MDKEQMIQFLTTQLTKIVMEGKDDEITDAFLALSPDDLYGLLYYAEQLYDTAAYAREVTA